jgi:hypothetical protein
VPAKSAGHRGASGLAPPRPEAGTVQLGEGTGDGSLLGLTVGPADALGPGVVGGAEVGGATGLGEALGVAGAPPPPPDRGTPPPVVGRAEGAAPVWVPGAEGAALPAGEGFGEAPGLALPGAPPPGLAGTPSCEPLPTRPTCPPTGPGEAPGLVRA